MSIASNSGRASREKRGSWNAAARALATTSSPSGRRASSEPMHPRRSPSFFSVTKVARAILSHRSSGMAGSGLHPSLAPIEARASRSSALPCSAPNFASPAGC